MKDEEIYSSNEYNQIKETKSFNNAFFNPNEIKKTKENVTIKEEYFDDNFKDVKDEKKAFASDKTNISSNNLNNNKIIKNNFKDRIIENTGAFRGIVSAVTCTVAVAAVATTTFLASSPDVTNVYLITGNDYLQYTLNIDNLDLDSSYKVEVSNPTFEYKTDIDVTKADVFQKLTGYVYGLKPNYQYEFKLLKDNGEIGGYSTYYSKKIYTKKDYSPTAIFNFNLEDNSLKFTSYLSDSKSLLSNPYISYKIGDEEYKVSYEDGNIDLLIENQYNLSITFDAYATLYDEEELLNSHTYKFDYFNSSYKDNIVTINGNIGDLYSSFKDFDIVFTRYDSNNEAINDEKQNIKNEEEFNLIFNTYDAKYYKFDILNDNHILYSSDMLQCRPDIIISNEQSLTINGLTFKAEGVDKDTVGYIKDINGNTVDLKCSEGIFTIPFTDENNNRYYYKDYAVTLDGFDYNLDVDMNQLYINDFELITINNKIYFINNGFISPYDNTYNLEVLKQYNQNYKTL